jgi:RNA polymerase sigma factor (sigma-70 family)
VDAAQWLEANWPLLVGVARAAGLSWADAEDAAQDAAIRAWRAWDRYSAERGTHLQWAGRIARNAAIDLHRKRRRWDAERLTPDLAVGDAEREALLRVEVAEAWARLTRRERRYARWLAAGYSAAQRARRDRIPLGTVKTRLRRMRQRLAH